MKIFDVKNVFDHFLIISDERFYMAFLSQLTSQNKSNGPTVTAIQGNLANTSEYCLASNYFAIKTGFLDA